MILTCPACATQYTVKDGAIPPGGRQVRCAACKHSWHQDPDEILAAAVTLGADEPSLAAAAGGPPQPDPDVHEPLAADVPAAEAADQLVGEEPVPAVDYDRLGIDEVVPDQGAQEDMSDDGYHAAIDEEQAFAGIPAMHDEDEPPRGRALGWLIGLVLVVIAAAAAFWFLAPAGLKARAGIAAGVTPLELMLTTSDRQKLASGNELLAISGRIINPTDSEQAIPPIEAELRNKATRKLVYKWTIAPPARSLAPRGSASFNSAEVDIPEGGDELTVTLGGKPG